MYLCDTTWLLIIHPCCLIHKLHLNNLCIRQQGRNKLLRNLLNAVDTFQSKLKLFQQQLSTGNTMQLKGMSSFITRKRADLASDFGKCAECVRTVLKTFQNAFEILTAKRRKRIYFKDHSMWM